MTYLKLLALLPQIVKLIEALERAIIEAKTERKVEDDLTALQKAIDAKDPSMVNHIFNNMPVSK